jgi:hypothetical protein
MNEKENIFMIIHVVEEVEVERSFEYPSIQSNPAKKKS